MAPGKETSPSTEDNGVFLLFNEGLVIRMVKALRQSTGVANRISDHPRLGDHDEAASRHAGDTTEPDRESREVQPGATTDL